MWGGRQLKAYVGGGAIGAAESLASATTIHTFTMGQRCRPIAAGVVVTTIGTAQSAIVTFTSEGGTTSDCGKVTVTTSLADGYGVYQKTDYNIGGAGTWVATLRRGQQVVVAVSQANTGGAGIPILIVEEDPDVFENETYWSATSNA